MRQSSIPVAVILTMSMSGAAFGASAEDFGAAKSPADPVLELNLEPKVCTKALAAMRTSHREDDLSIGGSAVILRAFDAIEWQESKLPAGGPRRGTVLRADLDLDGTGDLQTVLVRANQFNWRGDWNYGYVFASPGAFETVKEQWLEFDDSKEGQYPSPDSPVLTGQLFYPTGNDADGKDVGTGNVWVWPEVFTFEKRYYFAQGANYHDVMFPISYTVFRLRASGTVEAVCRVSQEPAQKFYAEFQDWPDVEALIRVIRVIGEPGPDLGTLHSQTNHATAATAGERAAAARPWAIASREEPTHTDDGRYHPREYHVYGARLDRFLEQWSMQEPWTRREYQTLKSLMPPAIESYSKYLVRHFGLTEKNARPTAERVLQGVLAQHITIPSSFGELGFDDYGYPKKYNTDLSDAVERPRELDRLLSVGPAPDAVNGFDKTPLMVAAHFNRPDAVRKLLKAGAKVDARTKARSDYGYFVQRSNRTALMYAAENAGPAVMKLLLDAGADASARDGAGNGLDFYIGRNPRFPHDAIPKTVQQIAAMADQAAGPSFDCARASSVVERTICSSEILRMLDREIADAFARLKPLRGPALLTEQRAWLRQRDRTCKPSDEDCLAEFMRTRGRALLLRVWETDGAN